MRLFLAFLMLGAAPAIADPPVIAGAVLHPAGNGYRIDVTLRHPDTGWDHYADGWEVLAPDGTRLGFRELMHPHVNEQPFTRSLSGLEIPDGIGKITIRARCNVDGWAEATFTLDVGR